MLSLFSSVSCSAAAIEATYKARASAKQRRRNVNDHMSVHPPKPKTQSRYRRSAGRRTVARWLTLLPNIGAFPQSSHWAAMISLLHTRLRVREDSKSAPLGQIPTALYYTINRVEIQESDKTIQSFRFRTNTHVNPRH